jgi:hypothetical protein
MNLDNTRARRCSRPDNVIISFIAAG